MLILVPSPPATRLLDERRDVLRGQQVVEPVQVGVVGLGLAQRIDQDGPDGLQVAEEPGVVAEVVLVGQEAPDRGPDEAQEPRELPGGVLDLGQHPVRFPGPPQDRLREGALGRGDLRPAQGRVLVPGHHLEVEAQEVEAGDPPGSQPGRAGVNCVQVAVDEPCLILVEPEPEVPEAATNCLPGLTGLGLAFEQEHEIVGVADQLGLPDQGGADLGLEPEIQDDVQVDIGEQR